MFYKPVHVYGRIQLKNVGLRQPQTDDCLFVRVERLLHKERKIGFEDGLKSFLHTEVNDWDKICHLGTFQDEFA